MVLQSIHSRVTHVVNAPPPGGGIPPIKSGAAGDGKPSHQSLPLYGRKLEEEKEVDGTSVLDNSPVRKNEIPPDLYGDYRPISSTKENTQSVSVPKPLLDQQPENLNWQVAENNSNVNESGLGFLQTSLTEEAGGESHSTFFEDFLQFVFQILNLWTSED